MHPSSVPKLCVTQTSQCSIDTSTSVIHCLDLQSYKLNQGAHYVAHLKISESDKLALKEFDRRLPFENEDLAIAAGIESTIPSRPVSHVPSSILGRVFTG